MDNFLCTSVNEIVFLILITYIVYIYSLISKIVFLIIIIKIEYIFVSVEMK